MTVALRISSLSAFLWLTNSLYAVFPLKGRSPIASITSSWYLLQKNKAERYLTTKGGWFSRSKPKAASVNSSSPLLDVDVTFVCRFQLVSQSSRLVRTVNDKHTPPTKQGCHFHTVCWCHHHERKEFCRRSVIESTRFEGRECF